MPRAVLSAAHPTSGQADVHELQKKRSTDRRKDQENQCCFRHCYSVIKSIHHVRSGNVTSFKEYILKGMVHLDPSFWNYALSKYFKKKNRESIRAFQLSRWCLYYYRDRSWKAPAYTPRLIHLSTRVKGTHFGEKKKKVSDNKTQMEGLVAQAGTLKGYKRTGT